mgnify:CR=1 FL=1
MNTKIVYTSIFIAYYLLFSSYAGPTSYKNITHKKETVKVRLAPAVSFSFSNDNSCSGEIVAFTNTSTGAGELTYNWDFGDGSSSTEKDPTHVFEALGCGTATFDVTLTVSDESEIDASETKVITVIEQPDIRFRDRVTGLNEFNNCGNTTSSSADYEVSLENISSSTCTSSYLIDWGDGNTTTSTTGNETHTYTSVGIFNLKIIGDSNLGCQNEVIYQVKNISNPAGGFTSPGNTSNLCTPTSLEFGITNWETNSSDTKYLVDFGDGSPIQEFTQATIEAENLVEFPTPHNYLEGTCAEAEGEFVATLTVQNGCGSTDFTISNITILEPSTVAFSSLNESCINTNVVFNNESIIADGANCDKNADFIWDFGDGTTKEVFSVDTSVDENHTYTSSGIFTVSLTIKTFCTTETFTKDICISPEITPVFTTDKEEGCIPLIVKSTNTTDLIGLCSLPTYEWVVGYTADNCGISLDWNFTNNTNATSENPEFKFNTPGKYTLTQKITTICGTATAVKVIDVKKPPTANIVEIADVCGNASINPTAIVENCTSNTNEISYNWTFNGGTPATSTEVSPTNIAYTTPGVYTISLAVTNACGISNTSTEQFKVFEKPIITNTNVTQEICSTQSTSEIDLTANNSGTVFSWTAVTSANITGFQATGNTNTIPVQTLTNSGNTVETVTFSVTPTLDGCAGDIVTFIITVNPTPIISTQPTSSEVCLNGAATILEVAYQYGSGTPLYQWFSNTSNNNATGAPIPNETASAFNPPTNTIGEIFYYVEVSFTSGSCAEIASDTASVNVVPQIMVDTANDFQTICIGGNADEFAVTYTNGTGNPSYQWFSNTTNTSSGGNPINGQTTSTHTPNTFTTVGDFYYYAEVYLDGAGCNKASSAVFEVHVLADPVIDTQAIADQELCQNATPIALSITVVGGTSSTYNYQWYQNNTDSNTNGTSINNATTASYTPNTSMNGTFYYYVIVSQLEAGCSVTSNTSVLKIKVAPSISTQPESSEICLDGAATLLEVAFKDGIGAPTYQWFSNTSNSIANGEPIANETNASYNAPTNVIGETFYYVKINFNTSDCSEIISNTAAVNVVPQISISTVNTLQTVCIDGNANELEVTYSGGTGNATYQWYSNIANLNSGGTAIPGETTSKYTTDTFTTTGDFYYYAEVSIDGTGCTSATSAVFTISVVAGPVINSQAIANQELCQNAIPADLTVVVSGGTSSTKNYQWFVNNTNATTGGTALVDANAATYTPETTTVGRFYYYLLISQPEANCAVTSAISFLKVNAAPTFTTQPTSSEICINETATLLEVAYQNGTGTPTYQWFSNTENNTISGTAIENETNTSYNPPTTNVGEVFYYAKISFSSVGCAQIKSNIASVIINEIPIITAAEITVYSEAPFNFNPDTVSTNTIPLETKYTWSTPTFSPTNAIIGASEENNPQDEISQTLENTGTTPVKVTYTVTPATNNCIGEIFLLEVIVNPSINSNAVLINNTCFESNDASITTNISGGIPFETGSPYLISWTGPNGFSSTDTAIENLEPGSYTLRVEDKEGFFITEVFLVTQPAILAITKDLEQNISCFQGNDGAIALTVSGGTTPHSYNWTTSNGSGIIQNIKNQNTLTAGTYTLEVIDNNNCKVQTEITLTEPEELKIETIITQDILCFGDATGTIEIEISGGTKVETSPGIFEYIYKWNGPEGFTSISEDIDNLIAGAYTIAVTDNLGCTVNATVMIQQSPEIVINYTKTDVSCNGKSDGSIDVAVTGGAAPYEISWSNFANGFSLSNLSADTYVATITDANNCVKKETIVIEEPLFFTTSVVTPISCNGKKDGAITLSFMGGVAPFLVTWNDDATAGLQRNNLEQGTYTVTITDSDANQCPIEKTFTLTNPATIAISATVIDARDCANVNSGSISIDTSGGTAPYSFLWNTNDTTENLENIPAGDYSLEITDANGCQITRQFNIFRQEPLAITLIETSITNCDLKNISKQTQAKVTGGYLPYTYSWSNGTVSSEDASIMTTSQSGSYTFTVTDDRGCKTSTSFNIDIPIIGDADFRYSSFALDTYDLLSVKDPIQFTNLSTGDSESISWDFGDGSPIRFEENPVHIYDEVGTFTIILKVIHAGGCAETLERTVKITKGYSLISPNAFTPNHDGFNDVIRPSHRGFTTLEMTIFNTWGTAIYYEKNTNLKGWNGNIKGLPAENGNYIMVVKGVTFYTKEITATSPLTLLK